MQKSGTQAFYTKIQSPIGRLTLVAEESFLTHLLMENQKHAPLPEVYGIRKADLPILQKAASELKLYFEGKIKKFTIPTKPKGTEFQKKVWNALKEIPYGKTLSYGALAHRIGNTNAARAVGLANGRNPISIIVPCHRVIGANNSLTGYGGGLSRKKFLLDLEHKNSN
ncbi:MAG: Methylated-DNA--protein-cysteine methyltransferase [Turneriella sp.]|nr:Methylated-DNA--protein-cysteine methyltransferase [Turneriella sp.]